MQICMLQLNPTIGTITANVNRIIDSVQGIDADIIVTTEMSICGYPPRDLLSCTGFINVIKSFMRLFSRCVCDFLRRRRRRRRQIYRENENNGW